MAKKAQTSQVGIYDNSAIDVVTNLRHIRLRPTGYIGSADNAGIIHMIRELIDNSIDELVIRPDGGRIDIIICRDFSKHACQVVVQDNGRGIPPGKLVEAMTILGASGKLGLGNAYVVSGGMYGYGAKVSSALSIRDRAITSNSTSKVVGSLYLEEGEVIEHKDTKTYAPNGTTIAFEIDFKFFGGKDEFMTSGYIDLVRLCKQLNIFNENIDFEICTMDHLIPETFWKCDVLTALNIIDNLKSDAYRTIEYSSLSVPDKSAYLFDMWKINSAIVYQTDIDKQATLPGDKLSFHLKLFISKKSATGNTQYFVTVNNVVLPDVSGNSGSVTTISVLRNLISPFIEDNKLKQFLLKEYKFPTLYIALGIQYQGAELSGITKTSFKDNIFATQYGNELSVMFSMKNDEEIKQIVDAIRPDIELRYSQFYDTPLKRSEDKKTYMQLTFSENYYECKSGDASKCELYIVEGTSASNIADTRDNNYQAIYMTRGKPENGATVFEKISDNRKAIAKNPIYKDIFTIMNIDDKTIDITKVARFMKLILSADADPDGAHIISTHINNIWIYNPRIIEAGIVYVANPPLFSMNVSKNKRMFLRDKNSLMDARIDYLYRPSLELILRIGNRDMPVTGELYREICYIIEHIGDLIDRVAKQLGIPVLILERLCMAIDHIYPTINYEKLVTYFTSSDKDLFIRVQTNDVGKYIVVSIGEEDFPIGVDKIGETIVQYLLPVLQKFKFYDLNFLMRSKFRGSTFSNFTPVSLMMIFIAMKQLDKLIKVSRYKGLGELPTEDCFNLLMNPATRSITQITSIGDAAYNYQLLGKNTDERKRLLTDSSILSNSFIHQNVTDKLL